MSTHMCSHGEIRKILHRYPIWSYEHRQNNLNVDTGKHKFYIRNKIPTACTKKRNVCIF